MEPGALARAETIEGPTVQAISEVAATRQVVILVPFMERRGVGVVSNSVALVGTRGEVIDVYRKVHIPDDPLFHEKYYFTPGDRPCLVAETPFGRIGVLVCWDQWFPEAARLAALEGAQLLIYPTAIGSIAGESAEDAAMQLDAWKTVQRGHAIANGMYVAAVNRVGAEGDISFWGQSFACGPLGEPLADLARDEDGIALFEVSPARIQEVRTTWPFFRDRRVDLYDGLRRRWGS
jgi:N-carbamoylputrescine amidase